MSAFWARSVTTRAWRRLTVRDGRRRDRRIAREQELREEAAHERADDAEHDGADPAHRVAAGDGLDEGELIRSSRLPYWRLNRPGDERYLKDIGLER